MNSKTDSKTQSDENSPSARQKGRGAANQQDRQARQARSLRDNLKKRKQQVRCRDAETKQGD